MKRLVYPLLCAVLAGVLSCSQKEVPPPPPSFIPIILVPTATPTKIETPGPLVYVLEDLKGNVHIREGGSTQAEPAEEEETVQAGDEIITQAASEASLTLDENTMFHLSENSDVQVDQLNPNSSNGFLSRITLLAGKALSEVEKLGDSHSTFEVEAGGVICGVRGTSFEIQKQGQSVNTLTFHGEVEMRKGDITQQVAAGHQAAFSLTKGNFQKPRPLNAAENQHYQNWLQKKSVVQQKQASRMAALRSLSSLSPDEKSKVMENLKSVKPKDRMRMMHQMLVPKAQSNIKPERNPGEIWGKGQGQNQKRQALKQKSFPKPVNRGKQRPVNGRLGKPQGRNLGAHHAPALNRSGKNRNLGQGIHRPGIQPNKPNNQKPSHPLLQRRPQQGKPQKPFLAQHPNKNLHQMAPKKQGPMNAKKKKKKEN